MFKVGDLVEDTLNTYFHGVSYGVVVRVSTTDYLTLYDVYWIDQGEVFAFHEKDLKHAPAPWSDDCGEQDG